MPLEDSPPTPKLYLFGTIRLESKGELIRLPTRKVESLLAYLVLHPEQHTREQLASLFWGDSSGKQARDSLRTALKSLRQHLGEDLLLADRETVQINPDFALWVDVREFEEQITSEAQAAVSLYWGELLKDFYDEWVLAERERYREQYLEGLLGLTQSYRGAGEYGQAIEYAQKVLAVDGANERAHQHLMFCYLAVGNRTAALNQYEACVRSMQEELAVEPSRETTQLYQWIKQASSEHASLGAQVTNLPIPLSSFIGRKKESAKLKELIASARLLTLTGAGGSGKTRLAIQVATDLIDRFHDGVWWVDLAPLSEGAPVSQAVAQALGVRDVPSRTETEMLLAFLRHKRLLLVLDNCEHLLMACAQLADELLTQCADLRIMATSREVLGLTGERVFQVPTLDLPDAHQLSLPQLIARYDGIQLFVERAAAVNPAFQMTPQNAYAVGQVCRQLDGIPLALELAAARVKMLTVEEIAVRLDDRFRLLTAGSRAALPRHQTLHATMEWSHDLLTKDERILLRRLSVFAGGSTLEAAEVVCAGEGIERSRVLDVLTHLVDKSLVVVEAPRFDGRQSRYQMLETIREYAREKLLDAGEDETVSDRHLGFYSDLAEKAEQTLLTEQVAWYSRLDAETSNLRGAIEWSMRRSDAGAKGKLESGLLLAGSLIWFLESRARRETSDLLRQILAKAGAHGDTIARAKGLNALGHLEWSLGNLVEGRSAMEEALAISRKLGDKVTIGWALAFLGVVTGFQEDFTAARGYLEEALAVAPGLGGLGKEIRGVALGFFGDVPMHYGNLEQAQAMYEESIGLLREVKSMNFLTYPLRRLGYAALHRQEIAKAEGAFRESLNLNRDLGHQLGMTACVAALAATIAARGAPLRAIELYGAVDSLLHAMNSRMFHPDEIEYSQNLATIRLEVDETTFNSAWATGADSTLEQAIDRALDLTDLKPE